jgi:Zn-dependent protease
MGGLLDMRSSLVAFRLFGLRVTVAPAAMASFIGLALVCAVLAARLAHLTFGAALLAGVLSALLFFISEILHHLGHALAARLTGYPMTGIHFFLILAGSVYPPDEPDLPAGTHVRRALGGFWVNVPVGLPFWPVASALWPRGTEILPPFVSVLAWVAGFMAVTNIVVLGLGALIPLPLPGGGVTDGGTLVKYLGRKA